MEEEQGEDAAQEPDPLFPAELHAAEALAADMDPWNVFDCRKTPRSEFQAWLENNRPSRVLRYGGEGQGNVGWICVLGPNYCPDDGDTVGLQDSWERMLDSGRPASFQVVRELARNHGVLSGKWLMHLEAGFKLDHAWEGVARAVLDGRISSAKVSPHQPQSTTRQVICVYNQDFTNEMQVVQLDSVVRSTGVKCPLYYKPDAYTHLGIYRGNCWRLCPTIYESRFDLERMPRRSLIINRVTGLEVT